MDMNNAEHIIEVNQDNFSALVTQKSNKVPILVDFWAPWCAPCRMLKPILTKIAREYDGKLVLVAVNTDQNPRLALDYRIRSLPTVKLFRNGEVVDEFFGAQPESVIRAFLERHLERDSDRLRTSAAAAWDRGDRQAAERLLRRALASDPNNHRIHPDLAKLLIEMGEYDEAEAILKTLPVNLQQEENIVVLFIRIKFGRIASEAPEEAVLEQAIAADPNNSQARYQLSARKVMNNEFEPALSNLLEIIWRDRQFGDDAGRKALLEVFTLLGNKDPLVKRYRSLLSSAIY